MGEASGTGPRISPTRTHATWKPGVSDDPLPFFRCRACASTFVALDGATGPRVDRSLRRAEAALPYAVNEFAPSCCGEPMERLEPAKEGGQGSFELLCKVVGGFDANALQVRWKSEDGRDPRWIALKTFTGMQVAYVLPGKRPPVTFALADEDAYAYCDEDPCRVCTFRCKSGFQLYAYVDGLGLLACPVHDRALTR